MQALPCINITQLMEMIYAYPGSEPRQRWDASKSQFLLKYLALQVEAHKICKEKRPSCLYKPTLLIWHAVTSVLETWMTAYRRPHVASTPCQKWKHTGVEEGMNSMKRNVLGACRVDALFLPVSPPSSPFCYWSWGSPLQPSEHAVLCQKSWP